MCSLCALLFPFVCYLLYMCPRSRGKSLQKSDAYACSRLHTNARADSHSMQVTTSNLFFSTLIQCDPDKRTHVSSWASVIHMFLCSQGQSQKSQVNHMKKRYGKNGNYVAENESYKGKPLCLEHLHYVRIMEH